MRRCGPNGRQTMSTTRFNPPLSNPPKVCSPTSHMHNTHALKRSETRNKRPPPHPLLAPRRAAHPSHALIHSPILCRGTQTHAHHSQCTNREQDSRARKGRERRGRREGWRGIDREGGREGGREEDCVLLLHGFLVGGVHRMYTDREPSPSIDCKTVPSPSIDCKTVAHRSPSR